MLEDGQSRDLLNQSSCLNKSIFLTTKGKEVAEKIYERHRFFTKRLIAAGVDPKTAERDACRLEHAISEESFQKLKDALED